MHLLSSDAVCRRQLLLSCRVRPSLCVRHRLALREPVRKTSKVSLGSLTQYSLMEDPCSAVKDLPTQAHAKYIEVYPVKPCARFEKHHWIVRLEVLAYRHDHTHKLQIVSPRVLPPPPNPLTRAHTHTSHSHIPAK